MTEPDNIWPPPPVRANSVTSSHLSADRRATKYGWIGAGLAAAGVLLPTLIFVLWMNYSSRVLDSPDMDDWYTGDGRTDLHCCQTVIIGLELVALSFGMRARRTVVGKLVFFIIAVALGFACKVMPELYWLGAHFN